MGTRTGSPVISRIIWPLWLLLAAASPVGASGPAAGTAPANPDVKITAIWPDKLILGKRAFVQLEPGGSARIKGDGSKPPVIMLDGRAMTGISGYDSSDPDKLIFELVRTAQDQPAWAPLLGLGKPNALALRIQGPQAITTPVTVTFDLLARTGPIVASSMLALFIVVGLLFAARSTTMLRDAGTAQPEASGKTRNWRQFGTFSLGRVQMAVWFGLVITSYLFIWCVTGDTPPITTSVLALIGIGSGTALGAAVIDDSKRAAAAELQQEMTKLQPDPQVPQTDAAKQALAVQVAALQTQSDVPLGPRDSQGYRDLLTDAGGWSFHRFQLASWTIVLGVIFVASVSRQLVLPDFDSTLLALLGISSGTYLGFKLPEKQS